VRTGGSRFRTRSRCNGAMRIAVISDVHGNLPASEAVLAAVDGLGVDLTVNCGDLLSGYVQPALTADRLMGAGLVTVAGNHERQVLTFGPERIGMADRVTRRVLSPEHLAWLGSQPATVSPVAGWGAGGQSGQCRLAGL
jgi:hypothetical protein